MKKLVLHIRRWNHWQKYSLNHPVQKLLVLFGIIGSPTFYAIYNYDKLLEKNGMNIEKDKVKSTGYKIGYFFGTVCFLCFTVIVIAATIKFVFWLF